MDLQFISWQKLHQLCFQLAQRLEREKLKPNNIKVAVLFFKKCSKTIPDFYLQQTKAWVIFPYEVRETVAELTKIWQKERLSKQEVQKRLIKLGFEIRQIEHYSKTG